VEAGWVDVGKVGRVRLILSRKNGERKVVGLVTNEPKRTARQIIGTYADRWAIEVCFRDMKQNLGLGQYQNLSYEAAVTHLHLVCFAYALLTHLRIQRTGAKGHETNAATMSTGQMQNKLRRIVWEDLAQYLGEFETGDEVIHELEQLLVAA
jgi:hypothetical protein